MTTIIRDANSDDSSAFLVQFSSPVEVLRRSLDKANEKLVDYSKKIEVHKFDISICERRVNELNIEIASLIAAIAQLKRPA